MVQAHIPAHAEAQTILEGFKILQKLANGMGLVMKDSKESVQAVDARLSIISDWRSFLEKWQSWKVRVQSDFKIRVAYCDKMHEHLIGNLDVVILFL